MDKVAIKNFSVWARNKLIADITYKAGLLGINEKEIKNPLQHSTSEVQFFDIGTKDPYSITGNEIKQRNQLIEKINDKAEQSDYMTAYKSVVEEVAYTWFNRLIAIRFMEVNDYLPSRVRVLSSESPSKLEPDLVTNPFDTDLEFSTEDRELVMKLSDENKHDELFRLLFIKQCNALNAILPNLFEETDDYSELLLNVSYTDKDGVIYRLVNQISASDFNVSEGGEIEIIGWMYQYYNTEPKDEAFTLLKKNVKITKERIPAATQLFTPDWIVRYMVENSLGRLWQEGHPNETLKSSWKYYLDEAEQEESVQKQLERFREEYKLLNPEDIKIIDPCMGSGHILVYAFDVLMQIYESTGYSQRDAAKCILENNLYGLDIDDRAYQMSYFAIMMKARQYNRRILSMETKCNIYSIQESNLVNREHLQYFGVKMSDDERKVASTQIIKMIDTLTDAKEYGSILKIESYDWMLLKRFVMDMDLSMQISFDSLGIETTIARLQELIQIGKTMSQKYEIVITNPPYMGIGNGNTKLNSYVKKHYPDSKADLFAVFIERCMELTREHYYHAMITQHSWMFLSSFEKLRKKIIATDTINMAHLGARAFEEIGGEVVQTTSWVQRLTNVQDYKARYSRLVDFNSQSAKEEAFFDKENQHVACKESFSKIPGSPIAYWASENMRKSFDFKNSIGTLAPPKQGLATADNDRFLRLWFEVSIYHIGFGIENCMEAFQSKLKWFPYNKGGAFRRWYGNREYIVNWENDGSEIKDFKGINGKVRSRAQNLKYYFRMCITWSDTTSASFSGRYCESGFIFDIKGSSGFPSRDEVHFVLGFLNSNVSQKFIYILNPTITTQVGDMARIPIIEAENDVKSKVESIVERNVGISKEDWDSFEASWDFKMHPLLNYPTIQFAFEGWDKDCTKRFNQLKANEEELNRIFIEIYGLQDELSPAVEDKDVTVRKADLQRDIKLFVSYAVGCMFGRYSLDVDGLAFAGGEWDDAKYSSFIPDKDNVIPITDEEYFEDDIVGLFVSFVKQVYGDETLEENLDFIAQALGNKGNTSREVIRNYFVKDFYKDHVKTYQKRPIYWLFDSGKSNGFKALVYMHRYDENSIGNLRVDYLHKMQRVYESEISRMQEMVDNGSGREVAQAEKRKEKLLKQLKETKEYDEKIAHLALARIAIDLDDGVKVNYEKVQTDVDGKKHSILGKI